MADPALLEGVSAEIVQTPRLRTHLLTGGDEGGEPVFFVHGNVSSSRFFEETLAALPGVGGHRGFAPDLRGFDGSETKPLDATRGLGDFSDDLYALAGALGLGDKKTHLVGWSAGGCQLLVNAALIWNARYTTAALDHLHDTRPELVTDDTLLARLSPVSHAHINPLGPLSLRQPRHAARRRASAPPRPRQRRRARRADPSARCQRRQTLSVGFRADDGATPCRRDVSLARPSCAISAKPISGHLPSGRAKETGARRPAG